MWQMQSQFEREFQEIAIANGGYGEPGNIFQIFV